MKHYCYNIYRTLHMYPYPGCINVHLIFNKPLHEAE